MNLFAPLFLSFLIFTHTSAIAAEYLCSKEEDLEILESAIQRSFNGFKSLKAGKLNQLTLPNCETTVTLNPLEGSSGLVIGSDGHCAFGKVTIDGELVADCNKLVKAKPAATLQAADTAKVGSVRNLFILPVSEEKPYYEVMVSSCNGKTADYFRVEN